MRLRPAAVFAVSLSALCTVAAGCAIVHRAVSAGSSSSTIPSLSSVAKARFVDTVVVDDGSLEVDPPGGAAPGIAAAKAEAMFRAADVVAGDHSFAVFGLGVATVSSAVPAAPANGAGSPAGASSAGATSTTATAPASTTTTTTGSGGTTTTSARNGPAPTVAPAPSNTTRPGTVPGQRAQGGVPAYAHRLAWVGIVWDAAASCGTPSSTRPGSGAASRYVVVLFDARTGHDALAYSSAAVTCGTGRRSPTVSRPEELVSVPWQPVGPASTAVHATLPACSQYAGWTQLSSTGGAAATVEVVARAPYDPGCGSTSSRDEIVDNVVPLGSAQAQLPHALVGPVDALQTLAVS